VKEPGHCRRCGTQYSRWLAISNWCTPCIYAAVDTMKDTMKSAR
jgi:hypothetical protein